MQQKVITKTCHIIIPKGRDFNKDSRKYLFAILGFFYKLLRIFKIDCKKVKRKPNIADGSLVLHWGPWKQKKPFNRVLHRNREQGSSAPAVFRRSEARRGRGKLGKMERGLVRTSEGSRVGLGWPEAGYPHEQAVGDGRRWWRRRFGGI